MKAGPNRAAHYVSPLRYPGGKAKLAPFMKAMIRANRLLDVTYVEPFAGGGGVGLSLLLHGYVERIVLNDLSYPIYAFWRSVIEQPDLFASKIIEVEISTNEWVKQREIFRNGQKCGMFDLGFATFYLNRTNRSGVLNGGMIGGYSQKSSYGLGARFNRTELAARVMRIARVSSQIKILNLDARKLLCAIRSSIKDDEIFLYIDPPYYNKGRDLYYDFFSFGDHAKLQRVVSKMPKDVRWIVTYDDVSEIREMYSAYQVIDYGLNYSVQNGRIGKEVMFLSDGLDVPERTSF